MPHGMLTTFLEVGFLLPRMVWGCDSLGCECPPDCGTLVVQWTPAQQRQLNRQVLTDDSCSCRWVLAETYGLIEGLELEGEECWMLEHQDNSWRWRWWWPKSGGGIGNLISRFAPARWSALYSAYKYGDDGHGDLSCCGTMRRFGRRMYGKCF